MQTLRKRTSPCKYKNDPSRFLGEGITFKAKLIGILEVNEARGDKMCQDALNDLKTAIRAAGEHKQRITISISIDGLRLRDEKTGDCLYHHPVHKISFIAQDMTDSRAFGYIFGSPDTGHCFFGIKTDKTASQVVISMRDLFQVVFELKKKEIEMAKHHSEQHHVKYSSTGFIDSIHFTKDENEQDKGKGKYLQLLKSRCLTSKSGDSVPTDFKGSTSEAIADLLDLEHELNNIQQGINQMEKITPSDPFGPLSKSEPYVDPFDDSFSKIEKSAEEKVSINSTEKSLKSQTSRFSENASEQDKHTSFFPSTASTSKAHFFSQFSPGIGKAKTDDSKWFDQETESLFNDTVSVNNAEPTSSPVALNTSAPEPDQVEGKKSPIKTDLFTELDPLGTGRVKPYVDKKDFFQELKNPPKKVLKELITEPTNSEAPSLYFPADFKEDKNPPVTKSDTVISSYATDSAQGVKDGSSKYVKMDPFYDGDPFEKTDPFQEENFPSSIGFPPLFGSKASMDGIFDDKISWKLEKSLSKDSKEEKPAKNSPTNLSLFSSSALRVSLPPEKTEGPLSISTITSKLKSSPNSPEDSKNIRRKCYQSLKQSTVEGSEESPVQEEPFVSTKIPTTISKTETEKNSPFKDKFYSVQLPSLHRNENDTSNLPSNAEISEEVAPEPPPRNKSALFSIKPPPLPPKKSSLVHVKPPPRPPSLEEKSHYEYLGKKQNSYNSLQPKEELKCVKLKKQLFTGKNSPPVTCELKKQNSDSNFPILPPPPQRKGSSDGSKLGVSARKTKSPLGTPGSILNLKLNQLDNTGLENLAVTLGIPLENIYSMTLQELTKMLSEKYLISNETKTEGLAGESFEADFDANFRKPETSNGNPSSSYDKYAVFKELIESENKPAESNSNKTEIKKKDPEKIKEVENVSEISKEEDKYAALRQLSLNATKSDKFIEEDDTDFKNDTCAFNEPLEESSSAINNLDLVAGIPDAKPKWQMQTSVSKATTLEVVDKTQPGLTAKRPPNLEEKATSEIHCSGDNQLFPLVDQFSDDKKPNSPRDNWATFEKSDFEDTKKKKSTDNFNDNENSPFSSDGKEEVREIPFHWHQNTFRKRTRKDVPWQDDDESWDDYSPKESYCSDESSHEERSPEIGPSNRYEKPWNVCGRPPKSERMWNDKSGQWNRRDKWQEETEDEFEETWRKQRDRTGSYETDRKNNFWHNIYENYNKRSDCCNSRSEPWDENDRHIHCYSGRRKRSESDNEFRKRCDSDVSDKECVWTFQKGYSDGHNRSGKQKQYHSGPTHSFRDCPEYCHESRSKHRKNVSQKRPSSASESKRNYEKMVSPGEYVCRSSEKTYLGKREADIDEYSRCQYGTCKEFRHRSEKEFSHYYNSYDRKMSSHNSKTGSRTNRGPSSTKNEMFPSPSKKNEEIEHKNHEIDYFDSFGEKNYKYGKSESRFTFDSEAENLEKSKKSIADQSPQDFTKSPEKKLNQWASTNGRTNDSGFYSTANTSDSFANFGDDFKSPSKKTKENGKSEMPSQFEAGKPLAKSKNLSMVSRQESSASLRKSDSINIFSRDKDPFEGDDFFNSDS